MVLSFQNNSFVLQGATDWPLGFNFARDLQIYYTHNISAAARFRSVADKKAEYIFNNVMLKSLPMPSGGPLSPKHKTLFEYQRERGVPHMLTTNHTYCAQEPGLGKSAQFISAVSTKPGLATIICPSFLKTTWAREITDWYVKDFPSIEIVDTKNKTNWSADFLIVSDSIIERPGVLENLQKRKTRMLAVDEAHRFKTPKTNRSIALYGGRNKKVKSRGLVYTPEHSVLLSGTPLLNRPIELWSTLYAMAPELINFMPYNDFGRHFCGGYIDRRGAWDFRGSSNEDELNKKIMGRFMLRIQKSEVLKDLPPKVREILTVDDDMRTTDVKALDRDCVLKFKKKKDFGDADATGVYAKLRHYTGLAKVNWVAKVVTEILDNDPSEQILLFGYHRDVVAALENKLGKFLPMVINGGVKERDRTLMQDLFQQGSRRLLIGNIDAMNLGLTLTKATRVMFAEYSWTHKLNEQAEDRAHRIGLLWSVFCQYFVLPGSFDEVMLNRIWSKEQNIERILKCATN